MSSKKLFWGLLTLLWCFIIFSFSSQSGVSSQKLSDSLVPIILINKFPFLGILIRKTAHFMEYAILFFLAANYFKEFNNPKYLFIALLFSILCAFFDEFHQLFVDGRSGQIKDVLIDSMGAFVTLLILRNIRVISK